MFNPKTRPVWGVRKWRASGGRFHKQVWCSISLKRQAQTIEDEPKPRGARSIANIANPWDDWAACWQRTWKVFGKRRKAWDR